MKGRDLVRKVKNQTNLVKEKELIPYRTNLVKATNQPFLYAIDLQPSTKVNNFFFVNIFIYPLFDEPDYLTLSYGGRIDSFGEEIPSVWDLDEGEEKIFSQLEDVILSKVLPWFESIDSIQTFMERIESGKLGIPRKDTQGISRMQYYHYEDIGLCAVWLGKKKKAVKNFELMKGKLIPPDCDWKEEAVKRADKYLEMTKDMDKFKKFLEKQVEKSIEHFKLPKEFSERLLK